MIQEIHIYTYIYYLVHGDLEKENCSNMNMDGAHTTFWMRDESSAKGKESLKI